MSLFRTLIPFLLAPGVLIVAAGKTSADLIVADGFSLFQTQSAVFNFGGPLGFQDFEGVPLGTFDFGGSVGIQNTAATDTIVRRLGPAIVAANGQTDTIDIELVALSLRSVDPINIGAGAEFVTAEIVDSLGSQLDITFDDMFGGTFDSTLVMLIGFTGETSGISFDIPKTLVATDVDWGRTPVGDALQIVGVNHLLKGDGTVDQDFWPVGLVTHDDGMGTQHGVVNGMPEPSGMIVLIAFTLLASGFRRRCNAK